MKKKRKQLTRRSIYLIIYSFLFYLPLCEYSYSKDTFFTETCYLDNSYVLLYKIINWWNDSEPDDDNLICDNHLRCELKGMSRIRYDNIEKSLTIYSNYQIEELISIITECKKCKRPAYLTCTYLNEKYFGTIPTQNISPINWTINAITIKGVATRQARQLIEDEEKIGIELGGIISGLLLKNGKIALHHNGKFLKECSRSSKEQTSQPTTFLTIKNLDTEEILARYKMVIFE